MANYILVKKHYTNEADVIAAILKDAKKNKIDVDEDGLKAFLEKDAAIMSKNPGSASSYAPSIKNPSLVYAFYPANNKVLMISRGNRTVLSTLPNGHKQVMLGNLKIVATF